MMMIIVTVGTRGHFLLDDNYSSCGNYGPFLLQDNHFKTAKFLVNCV